AGNFTGYGNGLDNVITGGSGNDTLYGGAGADQFIGGAGYDTAGYIDSKEAMVLNLRTNVVSGIGTGDTFTSIEAFGGSNFNDVFYGGSTATGIDGAGGQDMVTYELSEEAVTIDLLTSTANKGDAAGDTYTRVEIFQGSGLNDTLLGSNVGDTFIGGAGADTIDGRAGVDGVWYITNSTAVSINLQTQINQGGDAEGDVLLNIERVVGSHFDDVLIGDSGANYLEGGLGNDLINGGDGNDYIYGGLYSQIAPFTLEGQTNGPQADTLYGGSGNDNIVTAADDRGSRAYGEAGADVITVVHGTADGGDGNDVLTGTGLDFSLFGGAGDDKLVLKASGRAEGGEGDDTYTVDTSALVTIQDTGASRGDKLVLSYIRSVDLLMDRIGADLYLHRSKYTAGEEPKEGVLLKDWFAGYNTIEQIQTSDIQLISLPTSSSAMFA
ncbi:calcium-binding protein, partial [uncultured Pseudomonas sp.]